MSTFNMEFNNLKSIKLTSDINSCSFSIVNTLAIGTSNKTVTVWEWTEEGFVEAYYSPILYHHYPITSVIFSPDGRSLATSSTDGVTYMFNVKTGAYKGSVVQSMGGGVRESAMSYSENPVLATITDEGYIFMWNLQTYEAFRHWVGHEVSISTLSFSPDSYLMATGDSDGTYKLWLVDRAVSILFTADTLCGYVQKDAHTAGILTVAFSPYCATELVTRDYQLCSAGDDDVLKLWEVRVEALDPRDRKVPMITIKFLKTLQGHSSSVTCVRYTSDGGYIGSSSLDSTARIWEVSSGVCIRVLPNHKHSAFCCAFSPGPEFFASGSHDKTVSLWTTKNRASIPIRVLSEDEDEAQSQVLERRVFSVLDEVKLGSHVYSVNFNNQFDIVAGCSDKMIRFLGRKGMHFADKFPTPLKGHTSSVVYVEFSKCYQFLVTISADGIALIWDYSTGEKVNTITLGSQGGRVARFSPDCEWLALGCYNGKAHMWSFKSQKIKFTYSGHIESVNCVGFSPDGEYLATGCAAGQIKLWRVNPPVTQCICFVENVHDMGVMSCDFSNACHYLKGTTTRMYRLATGGNDSLVKVFKVWPVEELLLKAEEIFCLKGHGGSITEVRFSSRSCDVLASCAIDRTARVWNMQNGQCLNTLSHHKNQVTGCSWSPESTLLATGSLDSSVVIWKVPTSICLNNRFEPEKSPERVVNPGEPLDLITLRLDDVTLNLDDLVTSVKRNSIEIPDHFLCPITQQLMIDPVIIEDGFTYENDAIRAWLTNGRNTSPMTNVPLSSTVVVPNVVLKKEIKKFLVTHYDEDDINAESFEEQVDEEADF